MNKISDPSGIEAAAHGALANRYDALLIVGFGGPENPADVLPFLENVTRGRNIPRERLLDVAAHYDHLGGKSPINDQVRGLLGAGLLGQSQLASYAGRYAARDGPGWRSAGIGCRFGGVQFLFQLPPVSRGHRARPGQGRLHCASDRQDARLL